MNTFYKFIITALFGASVTVASASREANGVISDLPVDNASISRNGDMMSVNMDFKLNDYKLKGNKAVLFTPCIINGTDSLDLMPIGVYSKGRWHYYQRKENMLGEPDAISLKYSKNLSNLDYHQEVAYQDWMNGAHLGVKSETYACASCLVDEDFLDLANAKYKEFTPTFLFQDVQAVLATADVVKTRELSGRAYIDFPVNQTVIYPDYRRNTIELAKIVATIDSVKNDKDVEVDAISIKGFASPEGPYDNNIRLAKGRTEALKNYVQQLYKFPQGFIKTSYEPEDWEGLRDWVENSNIDNKEGILAIIDGNLAPDPKNSKLEKTYPAQYKFLLANVYPALRHSDYRIEYTIRQFTDKQDIEGLIFTQPAKLSYKEMMTLANQYEPGSDKYNEVFEIAVRMFPEEPIANLNVANAALKRGDLNSAAKYLSRAGDSPQAVYARANMAFLQGNYKEAGRLYKEAAQYLPEAAAAYKDFIDSGY